MFSIASKLTDYYKQKKGKNPKLSGLKNKTPVNNKKTAIVFGSLN